MIVFKQFVVSALVVSPRSLPLLGFQNFCLPPICNSNGKNMQNRPDGVSQPAIPQPISEPFLCLFFCTLLNKNFQKNYKSQYVSDESICRFIELIQNSKIKMNWFSAICDATFVFDGKPIKQVKDSHFHQTSKIANTLTLTLPICLHVVFHKNLSITSPSIRPKNGPGNPVLQS